MKKAKPTTPTSLGSLPLYGEQLPENGFQDIPPAVQQTCEELREVMAKVRDLRQSSGGKAQSEIDAQKHRGMVLFASLKKLNRLSHLYCKDTREQTHEQKLEVDDLHLQLQNLMYEAMHLHKEITNCLEFKSQHEDIELVSEEEFYSSAPEAVSRTAVTMKDEHQRMLAQLEWELHQRKQLASQRSSLEKEIREQELEISKKEEQLGSLQPALENLRTATLPLQKFLDLPMDRLREEQELAVLLPPLLYIVYMQAKAYSEVEDPGLSVSITGDAGEARAFQNSSGQPERSTPPAEEDSGDSDNEGGNSGRRKKRRKSGKGSSREQKDVTKAHPLTVTLTLTPKGVGSFKIALSYLPHFNAVCAQVTTVSLEGTTESQHSSFIDNSALLHCLFEGDTGRTSPNSVVSFHIRKQGGDVFSSVVRQNGFPYKWLQKACGVSMLAESPNVTSVQPQVEISAEYVGTVVRALKERFVVQVNLTRQLLALEEHQLLLGPNDGEELFPDPAHTKLVRWKHSTLQEVQATQHFGSLSIFNLQERTNRFFLATLQHGQARLYGLVCIGTGYPVTPPCFAVMVESTSGETQREPHDIQIKNLEAEVNLHFPWSLKGDKHGKFLLCRQLRRLQECFDVFVESKKSPSERRTRLLHQIRGRGRLLSFTST